MNKTSIILVIVVVLLALAYVLFGRGEVPAQPNDGVQEKFDKAPTFSLKDYSGTTVATSDFAGKVLVINAWAVWCPFCRNELPDFALLQEEFGDQIAVIAIDRQESLNKAKEFTDSIGVTDRLTFLLDPTDSFYKSIGGFSMPETIFVDEKGNIRIHKRGPMEFEEMKEKVESIL